MRRAFICISLIAAFAISSSAQSQPSDFNPYTGLAAIKRFVFVNGFFATAGSDKDLEMSDRELKNIVVLKLRNYVKDTPYIVIPALADNPQTDGRFVCQVMSVGDTQKIEYALHVRCSAGMSGIGARDFIWDNSFIAIVGKTHAREAVLQDLDRLTADFAGEFYRAKAEQAGRKK